MSHDEIDNSMNAPFSLLFYELLLNLVRYPDYMVVSHDYMDNKGIIEVVKLVISLNYIMPHV